MDRVSKAALEKMRIALVNFKCDIWAIIDEETDGAVIDKLTEINENLNDAYWGLCELTKGE